MTTRYRFLFLFPLLALIAAGLACNFSRRNAELTKSVSPDSSETAAVPELAVTQAAGQIRLVLSEAYLTDMLRKEFDSRDNPPLRDARIVLEDRRMILTGKAQQGFLQADLVLVMELSADNQGSVDVNVITASLGDFSLPESVLDELSATIRTIFETQVSPEIENFYIDEIIISDGEMTIQGHAR